MRIQEKIDGNVIKKKLFDIRKVLRTETDISCKEELIKVKEELAKNVQKRTLIFVSKNSRI